MHHETTTTPVPPSPCLPPLSNEIKRTSGIGRIDRIGFEKKESEAREGESRAEGVKSHAWRLARYICGREIGRSGAREISNKGKSNIGCRPGARQAAQ